MESSKILMIHSSSSRSHVIPLQSLANILLDRGHEVTFVSMFPQKKNIKNYREIGIVSDEKEKEFIKQFLDNPGFKAHLNSVMNMPRIIASNGNKTLQAKEVQKLMKEEKFDLVIVGFFFNEYLLGLGDVFKCPTIIFNSFGLVSNVKEMTGNPLGIPAAQHVGFMTGESGFFQRLATFLIYTLEMIITKFTFTKHAKEVYE